MGYSRFAFLLGFSILLLSKAAPLEAQDISQLHLRGTLPGTFLNPGLPLDKTWNISLANISVALATDGPSINGITSKNAAGQRYIDVKKLPQNPADYYSVSLESTVHTIDMGVKAWGLGILAGHRFSSGANVRYTGSLLELAAKGNAAFIGQSLQIGPSLDATAFNEVYLGAQKSINNFTLGIRAKLLYGTASLLTEESAIQFTTKEEYYQLELKNDYLIRSSGLLRYNNYDDITVNIPGFTFDNFFYNNRGFAVDLGASFRAGDKLTFSASALDLGSIKWDFFPRKYTSKGTFSFDGLDIVKYLGDTTQISVADTILEKFTVVSGVESYKTLLNNTFSVGAVYEIKKGWTANALYLLRNEYGTRKHYLTLSTVKKISVFDLGAMYSISKNNFTSLGLYARLNAGLFSGYLASDNVIGVFSPFNSKRANLRIGASFQF